MLNQDEIEIFKFQNKILLEILQKLEKIEKVMVKEPQTYYIPSKSN